MLLTELIRISLEREPKSRRLRYTLIGDPRQLAVQDLTDDSRRVSAGSLFFAVRGVNVDGHHYMDRAAAAGAVAIVCEQEPENLAPGVCYIVTPDSRELLGLMAAGWYGHPSRDLKVVGITGTNGKTTTATLLYRLYMAAGYPTGLLSTVRNYINHEPLDSTHTTPGALALQALLARMRDAGCEYVFMEVSSHAVDQRRIAGLYFTAGVFTNLTRDHLDYHHTLREYLYAKKRFLDDLPRSAFALSNADDRNGEVMLQNTKAKTAFYALRSPSDYHARILEQYADSTLVDIDGHEVLVRLVGTFNIYNLLAVYATASLLGMPCQEALRRLSSLTSVDGRLETFASAAKGYTAVVDYAHTPDALVNVLRTLEELRVAARDEAARVICVVGCGGDRDRGKRPLMAREAVAHADHVILTADNPRSEDPRAIIEEMLAGVDEADRDRVQVIVDRAEAIETACTLARSHDLVLIAGKGHETYQEVKGVRHPFDDREVIRHCLERETSLSQ